MRHPSLTRRSLVQSSLAATAAVATGGAVAAQDAGRERGVEKGRIRQSSVAWCYGGPLDELAPLSARLGLAGIDTASSTSPGPPWPGRPRQR